MKLLTLIPLLLVSAAALAQDTSTLKSTPVKDAVVKYKLVASSKMDFGEGNVEGTVTTKILSVAADGGFVAESHTLLKVTFTGGEIPIDQTGKTTFDANGEIIGMESEGADESAKVTEIKASGLRGFHTPKTAVKVGDTWTYTREANSKNGDTGVKVDYKVEGAEELAGHKVFKVHATGKETGSGDGTIDATFWVDRASGLMVKSSGSLKHVEIAQGQLGDTTYTLTLVE